jgi:hypothetical protein
MKKWILGLVLAYSFSSLACNIDGTGGFAPENDMNISTSQKSINGIDEAVFNQVIDEISAVYEPIIKAAGDKFQVNRKWDDGTVNASAQRSGKKVIVNMYGGLARHDLITKDGFAIVMCHEMGHHLGGAPKVGGFFNKWASNEGQSDYFANLKCFRKVYGSEDNVAFIKTLTVPAIVTERCSEIFSNEADSALCVRSNMAAKSTADLLGSLRNTGLTDFTTPDASTVSRTNNSHPDAQCRLDTYFAASLCDKDMNEDVDNKDPNKGTCNRKDGDIEGMRSLCWYAPKN